MVVYFRVKNTKRRSEYINSDTFTSSQGGKTDEAIRYPIIKFSEMHPGLLRTARNQRSSRPNGDSGNDAEKKKDKKIVLLFRLFGITKNSQLFKLQRYFVFLAREAMCVCVCVCVFSDFFQLTKDISSYFTHFRHTSHWIFCVQI